MKRSIALSKITTRAYRDAEFDVRTYIENRISKKVADQAYREGLALREAHIASGEFPKLSTEHDRNLALESLK